MRRLLGLLALVTAFVATAGAACMPEGREFTRPTMTTFRPGVSTVEDVTKALGPPSNQVSWARSDGVLRQTPDGVTGPTPFAPAPLGGTVKRLHYYYAWKLGEGVRSGVEPARSTYVWFFDDKLIAISSSSSFKADATGFDESKVSGIKGWQSLRADVIAAFGPPSGFAVYPATESEDREVLIYRGFEWDTGKNQYSAKFLHVLVNGLGIVEDVRFSGSTRPIPPPAPVGGGGVPIQIYTPPRSRGK